MRFKLYFDLEKEEIPIDYRKSIISFFKHCLSEYNEEEFRKLYNDKEPIIKSYTFAVFFNRPEFTKDKVIVNNKKMELNISIYDYHTAIILYNSFNHQKNKNFALCQNSMILRSITMVEEKEIKSDTIQIKFLSPLVVRDHNRETKKDYYYSYESSEFVRILKINIKEQMKITDIPSSQLETFTIYPIQAKKTVIQFYEKQIEASLGIYQITAQKELLEFLYKAGMGSKRSSGFGMFTII